MKRNVKKCELHFKHYHPTLNDRTIIINYHLINNKSPPEYLQLFWLKHVMYTPNVLTQIKS